MVKVSIFMSAYNEDNYISEAIDSVLKQDFQDWELIIINDASTDNTENIAQDYSKKDKRIKLINIKKNIGQVKIFAEYLQTANGRYITLFDADDIMDKERIKIQLNAMKEQNADFSYCNMIFLHPEGSREIKESLDYQPNFRELLIKKSKTSFDMNLLPGFHLGKQENGSVKTVVGGTFMFRKQILKKCKFDAHLWNMGDHDFWFQVIGKGLKIIKVPQADYIYRQHDEQRSRNNTEKMKIAARYINEKLKNGVYFI